MITALVLTAVGAGISPQTSNREANPVAQPDGKQIEFLRQEARRVPVSTLIRDLRRSRGIDIHGRELTDMLIDTHAKLLLVEEERGRLSWARETLQKLESKTEVFAKLAEIPSIGEPEGQQVAYDSVLKDLDATDDSLRAAISLRRTNSRIREFEQLLVTVELLQVKYIRAGDHGGEALIGGATGSRNSNRDWDLKQLKDRLNAYDKPQTPEQPKETPAAKQDYEFLKDLPQPSASGKSR